MSIERTGRSRPAKYEMSGQNTLKRAVNALGSRAIDRRSRGARSVMQFQNQLTADLGGRLTTSQRHLVERISLAKWELEKLDVHLMRRQTGKGARAAAASVLREQKALEDRISRDLERLGLLTITVAAPKTEDKKELENRLRTMSDDALNEILDAGRRFFGLLNPGVDVTDCHLGATSKRELALERQRFDAQDNPAIDPAPEQPPEPIAQPEPVSEQPIEAIDALPDGVIELDDERVANPEPWLKEMMNRYRDPLP